MQQTTCATMLVLFPVRGHNGFPQFGQQSDPSTFVTAPFCWSASHSLMQPVSDSIACPVESENIGSFFDQRIHTDAHCVTDDQ